MGELRNKEQGYQLTVGDIEISKNNVIKLDKENSKHLKLFYNGDGKLDIYGFLKKAEKILNSVYQQPWENKTFGKLDNFMNFLTKIIKLHILFFNLKLNESKKIRKSVFIFGLMYGEILNYGEVLTEDVQVYLEKNKHNEQKKEEIKKLVERDYEIFFGEGTKGKTLNTKVGQTTNEIIEIFSDSYYGSLDNKDNIK